MIKKDYMKPTMKVFEADMKQQILAGSVTSVTTTGLDDDEELELPDDGLPKSGSIWDDAW